MKMRHAIAALPLLLGVIAFAADSRDPTLAPKVEYATHRKMNLVWPLVHDGEIREALVMLQFDVLASGKVANIKVADGGFYDKRFVESAMQALQASVWEPKRIGGKPVDSLGLIIPFVFSNYKLEKGVTPEFRNELVRVKDLVEKREFAAANSLAERMLSERVKLIYEYALLQAQLAETYAKVGNLREAMRSTARATERTASPLPQFLELQTSVPKNSASNYLLPKEIVVNLLGLRMRLLARQGLLLEAMQAYYELAGLVELKSIDPLAVLAEDLTTQIKGSGKLVGKVEIGEEGGWRQFLSRHSFTLENIQGSIRSVELKCSATPEIVVYKPGEDSQVPAAWGICAAHVAAEPGTTFDFVEYPDPPATAPVP